MPESSSNQHGHAVLGAQEFAWISRFLYERTGILLSAGKEAMVVGRLDKRLRHFGLSSYSAYFGRLGQRGHEQETQAAIDLLTTNETYFFREPAHFSFIEQQILSQWPRHQPLRIWSAASSSGEEAYSVAMLAAHYTQQWEVLGTDISSRVLEKAQRALYPLSAAEKIPPNLLKQYCLKGREEYEDFFLIDNLLRSRVQFKELNLIDAWPADLGQFDLIFLRNVMIYFDMPTKQRLISRMMERLRPGGYFFVSHSESLTGISSDLSLVKASIYRYTP